MNPFGTPMLKSRPPTLRSDPLNMKSRPSVLKGRKSPLSKRPLSKRSSALALRQQAINRAQQRHRGGNYSTGTDDDPPDELEVTVDDLNDLKDVDDNKYKTMDWTEPDGSKTTLKFDEEGTLIGKTKSKSTKSKSRPEKFSKDLKQSVEKNAKALASFQMEEMREMRMGDLNFKNVSGGE